MKKHLLRNSAIGLLTALFVITPAFTYAKNDKNNGNNNKNKQKTEKVEVKNENDNEENGNRNSVNAKVKDGKCMRAYGHLFAFGWLKKNERPEINWDCFLPFGIAKKFKDLRGENASTTPDTIAPVLSGIKTQANITSAKISWNTNEKSDSVVFWSINTPVNLSSASSTSNTDKIKSHEVTLNGLSASTTYYAIVRSRDAAGNTATSSEFSFVTKPLSADVTAPTISSVIAVVGTSTANIAWQTNELATSKVYYSTTTPLVKTATSTNFVESATPKTTHLLSLIGLSTSTTYYLVIESKDASGNTQNTSQFSITTASGI